MALTAQYWFLDVELVDRGDRTTHRRFQLVNTDSSGDAAVVLTAASNILTALQALTDLVVKSYSVGKKFVETALTLPTAATAEVEQHALVTAQIRGIPNKSAVIDIPGPKDAVFLATSGSDADKVNFVAAGIVETYLKVFDSTQTNLAKVSDGEFINYTIHKGTRTHSKSSKG